jgi:hypothetical protein
MLHLIIHISFTSPKLQKSDHIEYRLCIPLGVRKSKPNIYLYSIATQQNFIHENSSLFPRTYAFLFYDFHNNFDIITSHSQFLPFDTLPNTICQQFLYLLQDKD